MCRPITLTRISGSTFFTAVGGHVGGATSALTAGLPMAVDIPMVAELPTMAERPMAAGVPTVAEDARVADLAAQRTRLGQLAAGGLHHASWPCVPCAAAVGEGDGVRGPSASTCWEGRQVRQHVSVLMNSGQFRGPRCRDQHPDRVVC